MVFWGTKLEKQPLACSDNSMIMDLVEDIVIVAHIIVETGMSCGKNEPTQMGTGYISVGRKIR